MRHIKTIDDITKDGNVEFGEGYDFVPDADGADAILMRSTDLHGYDLPESVRAIARCGAGENAYTMFDTDEHLEDVTIEALKAIPAIYRVRVIK